MISKKEFLELREDVKMILQKIAFLEGERASDVKRMPVRGALIGALTGALTSGLITLLVRIAF